MTAKSKLTPEQQAEAGRLEQDLREAMDGDVRNNAELLAGYPNERLFATPISGSATC